MSLNEAFEQTCARIDNFGRDSFGQQLTERQKLWIAFKAGGEFVIDKISHE